MQTIENIMINFIRRIFPERHPLRLFYHKSQAVIAAILFNFPSHKLKIIAVTGTSGKSTTVNLIHYLIQSSGTKCGAISGINFRIGEETFFNETLRTTLRPWQNQKLLKKMVNEGCEFCVIEISSHAIDQNRIWGIAIDTAVLTNISDNEHLDYHTNFAEYVRTKSKIFDSLNLSYRKPNVPKISVLNLDDPNYELYEEFNVDRKWSYSTRKASDATASDIKLGAKKSKFHLKLPNVNFEITTNLLGKHNIENLIAAVSAVSANGIPVADLQKRMEDFPGIPGRLTPVNEGQAFSVVVDFSYKPSALEAVLKTLRGMITGKIIIVFGGTGSRTAKNLEECGKIMDINADEIVLTTDDPNNDDPRVIAENIQKGINREEGEHFFEIEDRYEAIRYAIYIAEPNDCVLIAGRGHEVIQTIGNQKIPFDDKKVAEEILQFANKDNLLD